MPVHERRHSTSTDFIMGNRMNRQLVVTALARGLRKRCPHCGRGPLFSGFWTHVERCPYCGSVYERNPGDTWSFTVIGDRLPIAAIIAMIYFGAGAGIAWRRSASSRRSASWSCGPRRTGGVPASRCIISRGSRGRFHRFLFPDRRSDMSFRLSVLDQSPISEGATGAQALANTIDLARLADALGYHRYWVAEHHGTPMLACASPEALIGPIGALTSRIRVGSGGVMLPHYSPLKVAETFSMLSGLFPHRIDLAVGRAPGTDTTTMFALQRDRRHVAPDDFPQQLAELLAYLDASLPAAHPFAHLAALPGRPNVPTRGYLVRLRKAASGQRNWGCRTPSPISSTRQGSNSPPATAPSSSRQPGERRRGDRRPLGRVRRQ